MDRVFRLSSNKIDEEAGFIFFWGGGGREKVGRKERIISRGEVQEIEK